MNANIAAIWAYISECPLFAGKTLTIDRLAADEGAVMIQMLPNPKWTKQYISGGGERELLFTINMTMPYSGNAEEIPDTHGMFEAFALWLYEQNDAGQLPMPNGYISAVTDGYLVYPGRDTARYQMQCKLTKIETKGR